VQLQVPVSLSNPSAEPVTVDWSTLDTGGSGVATAGVDYEAASGTVTFAPGETSKVVSITVYGDTVDELPLYLGEWILVAFSNPSANATLDTSFFGLGIGIILDDDPAA
jgi:chitinase